MCDFEFVIPLKKDDLQVSVEGQYFVAEVLPVDTIHEKLRACTSDLLNDGSSFILKHFDLLYSVIVEFGEFDWEDVHKIYDKIIGKSISLLCKFVEETFEIGLNDSNSRIEALNILKMTLYIYSQFFYCYMNKMSMKTETITAGNVKGRKKKNKNDVHIEEYSWDWEDKQRSGLVQIHIVLQHQLSNLWDPPVVEETFVNIIADCCYRALEQSSISLVKCKLLKDTVIKILGVLVKQYNHGKSFVVKSVQLLKRFEHVASPLAEAVLKYIDQLGCKSLIKHLIDEILEASELFSSVTDNHSAKSFSSFLTEIAESNPSDVEPVLDSVLTFLDSEMAALRSLGLCVVTEVLLGCLSGDNVEKDIKQNREKCLEVLSDHLLDINAHVRAKVLQLWQKIVSHGSLPKDWIIPLMKAATERLIDVSSIVTKQAVHLIRLMMETNPFAAKLSLDELTRTLEEETAVYNEMKKNQKNIFSGDREKLWNAVEPELRVFLEGYFKEGSNLKAPPESPDLKTPRLPTISSFISEKKFHKAINLFIYAEDTLSGFKDLRKGIKMSDTDFYLGVFKSIFLDNQNVCVHNLSASNTDSSFVESVTSASSNEQQLDEAKAALAAQKKRVVFYKYLEKNATSNTDSSFVESVTSASSNEQQLDEAKAALAAQKKRVVFYKDCVEFVKHLNAATEKIVKLLSSKQVFDVIEAIEYIKLSKQFGVAGSDAGVIEMMKLINCPEESIRSCATRAFEQLYLQPDRNVNGVADIAFQVVKNLSTLVKNIKLSQEDSLSVLIKEWVKTSAINVYCITAMISTFSMEQPEITPEDSLAALILFTYLVKSQPQLVNDNLDVLIQKGILRGRKKMRNKDLRIVRYVCEILLFSTSDHSSKRFLNDHRIFSELYNSIVEHFLDFGEENYLYMVESAINLWFKLAMQPEQLCLRLIVILHSLTLKNKRTSLPSISESGKLSSSINEEEEQPSSTLKNIPQEALLRFIFIIGHVCLRLCLYLEQDVLEEKKRRNALEIMEKDTAQSKNHSKKKLKGVTTVEEEDELDMAVGVASANDDTLAEEIRLVCENEILFGDGILAKFANLPRMILENEGRYDNVHLKSVTSVTLGQFMMVSNRFCSQNIQLFITVLERTNDVVVKNNLVIQFGELLFRHPNVLEPWISYLYSRLRDPCRDVRLNTLLVISHLITNEMVKVKAQISDVALCIVDNDEEIKETATRLFHELSSKGNTLYNVLPDIISTLSNPDAVDPLTEENFQKILRYMIELIQKEKQMELLVEKLCVRLRSSESERQWSDLCFCLSLFSYSERSIRKLIDNYHSSFSTKLHCSAVYNCISGIIASANKSIKPAVKEAAAELSAMLDEADKVGEQNESNESDDGEENRDRTTSLNDENGGINKSTRKQLKLKTPNTCRKGLRGTSVKKSARATSRRKASAKSYSDSDDDSGKEFKSVGPSSRPVRSTRRKLVINDDDDDDNDNEEKNDSLDE
ncbi:CAP-D2 condensin subunit [Lycorma delicatula]|uniref:CAP-D2 condensin subunit n=1 Tax=Lycorma delicatula TaxID=130591 RepID=UPI003F51006E